MSYTPAQWAAMNNNTSPTPPSTLNSHTSPTPPAALNSRTKHPSHTSPQSFSTSPGSRTSTPPPDVVALQQSMRKDSYTPPPEYGGVLLLKQSMNVVADNATITAQTAATTAQTAAKNASDTASSFADNLAENAAKLTDTLIDDYDEFVECNQSESSESTDSFEKLQKLISTDTWNKLVVSHTDQKTTDTLLHFTIPALEPPRRSHRRKHGSELGGGTEAPSGPVVSDQFCYYRLSYTNT